MWVEVVVEVEVEYLYIYMNKLDIFTEATYSTFSICNTVEVPQCVFICHILSFPRRRATATKKPQIDKFGSLYCYCYCFYRREFGLERFVPASLMESMKRKELRRLIGHFLKLNQQMTGSSKMLTQLQVSQMVK